MIRVMHVSSSLQIGGVERMIRDFAERLDPDRYHFSACALESGGAFCDAIEEMGWPVFVLKKRPGVDLSLPFVLYRLFREQHVDVVHTHNFSPFLYGTLPARFAGVKVLVHTEHARATFPDASRRMLAQRLLSRQVNVITAVSTSVKQDLVTHERIAPQRIQVIRNGIDAFPVEDEAASEKLRFELGIPRNSPVVGVCCRLTAQKGVAHVIEAAPAVLAKHPDTVFLLVGDGELRGELERLAASLGLGRNIVFTGFRTDIARFLGLFDVYVLPSLFEGTSLGLLEAMAHGAAVVATRVGGNSEVIEHGVSGKLVEAGRPLELIAAVCGFLANPAERASMGQAASIRVRSLFSLNRMINEYDCLYRELMESANGGVGERMS